MKEISISKYNADANSINNKINLTQHMFSFLIEGRKQVSYADKQEIINPDQFMLLSSGNCLMSEKTASNGGRYQSILLFFDRELLADFFLRHPKMFKGAKMRGLPFLVFKKDAFLLNFIESLGLLIDAGISLSDEMKSLKLEEILLYLGIHHPENLQQLRELHDVADYERLIRQAVHAGIDQTCSLEELAFICHMSLSTFKRRFAEIYMISPSRWLLEKRMEKAAQLLSRDGKKASEIYSDLGYRNLSGFIQAFKLVYGITPKKFQYQSDRLSILSDR